MLLMLDQGCQALHVAGMLHVFSFCMLPVYIFCRPTQSGRLQASRDVAASTIAVQPTVAHSTTYHLLTGHFCKVPAQDAKVAPVP